jgi:hypothetical protein
LFDPGLEISEANKAALINRPATGAINHPLLLYRIDLV